MALTEQTVLGELRVKGDFKHVEVRMDRVIYDNNTEVARKTHRCVISPGSDCSEQCAEVQAICDIVHTPEVIAAYQAHVANQEV